MWLCGVYVVVCVGVFVCVGVCMWVCVWLCMWVCGVFVGVWGVCECARVRASIIFVLEMIDNKNIFTLQL